MKHFLFFLFSFVSFVTCPEGFVLGTLVQTKDGDRYIEYMYEDCAVS